MSKRKLLSIVGVAVVVSVAFAATSLWTQRNACAARAAEAKLEAVYYLRHGCMFKLKHGWSSVIYSQD